MNLLQCLTTNDRNRAIGHLRDTTVKHIPKHIQRQLVTLATKELQLLSNLPNDNANRRLQIGFNEEITKITEKKQEYFEGPFKRLNAYVMVYYSAYILQSQMFRLDENTKKVLIKLLDMFISVDDKFRYSRALIWILGDFDVDSQQQLDNIQHFRSIQQENKFAVFSEDFLAAWVNLDACQEKYGDDPRVTMATRSLLQVAKKKTSDFATIRKKNRVASLSRTNHEACHDETLFETLCRKFIEKYGELYAEN